MSRFLTLSSDSKFPDNTLSNFTCLFENPIYLNTESEVAVTELHYPCDYNYLLGEISIRLDTVKLNTDNNKQEIVNSKFLFFTEKITLFEKLFYEYNQANHVNMHTNYAQHVTVHSMLIAVLREHVICFTA